MEEATHEESEPHDVLECDPTDSSPQKSTQDHLTSPIDTEIRCMKNDSSEICKKRNQIRSEFNDLKSREKSSRWGKYKIYEGPSSVAHLEYDFSRGWPPVLISPVQKAEVESLQFQLGVMSVESMAERKKKMAEKIRKYRDELKLKQNKALESKI